MNPPVTVIVPCFNEESGLPPLLERLAAVRNDPAAHNWQFLFVDDGSTDGTFALLLRAARDESWIEVARHHENLGLGAALRTGFARSTSPIVCTMDSDCTYPPERLPELTALIENGADICTASAWHPTTAGAEGNRMRILLSRRVSGVYKWLIGQDVYTFTCLFRAYRRDVVEKITFRADGFSSVAEIFLKAMISGYTVCELPIPLERRRYGDSKLRISDAVLAHAHLIALTALMLGTRRAKQSFGGGRNDPLTRLLDERRRVDPSAIPQNGSSTPISDIAEVLARRPGNGGSAKPEGDRWKSVK